MAVVYHPIPALDPMLPQHSLLSSRSHPPCLIPPPSNRWCCRAGKVSHCLFPMGHGRSLALNKLQFLMRNITVMRQQLQVLIAWRTVFVWVERGQGQELQGWRLRALGLCYCLVTVQYRPPSPPRTCSRERSVVPSTSPSPNRYLGTLTKVKEEVRASLCKYKV